MFLIVSFVEFVTFVAVLFEEDGLKCFCRLDLDYFRSNDYLRRKKHFIGSEISCCDADAICFLNTIINYL